MRFIELNNENKNNTLLEGDYFRVHSISRISSVKKDEIIIATLPLKEGLGIEKKQPDGSYIVSLFVKYDKDIKAPTVNSDAEAQDVLNILQSFYDDHKDPIEFNMVVHEFLSCVQFAKQALLDLNEEDTGECVA